MNTDILFAETAAERAFDILFHLFIVFTTCAMGFGMFDVPELAVPLAVLALICAAALILIDDTEDRTDAVLNSLPEVGE